MKIDAEQAIALRAVVRSDIESIRRLDAALAKLDGRPLDENAWIAAGYHLHRIYNALENTFDQISRTFENHVKDTSRWHDELLRKMFLDMSPLRPAVLPVAVRADLQELRGFRHVFRHAYGADLDFAKLRGVWDRWLRCGPATLGALETFANALDEAAGA